MGVYIIKSLKWSDTPSYLFQTVYWGDNSNGYTTDINKAGLYTEEQVQERRSYFDNGHTTKAISVESKEVSNVEFDEMKLDLTINKKRLGERKSRFAKLKETLRDLEIELKEIESSISKQEQEVRIQALVRRKEIKK